MGFLDSVFLGMRPWTRASVSNMLDEAGARIEDADPGPVTDEAQDIYDALNRELNPEVEGPCGVFQGKSRIESVYTVLRGISGTPLNDSFHLGQTIINDYGRPYENGFDSDTGASGYLSAGRFLLYARGEFESAPSAAGYSTGLADTLFAIDYPALNSRSIRRPPSRLVRSPPSPAAAGLRLTSPRTPSATRSPSASRTTGLDPASARAWPTPTTRKTCTRSASIASSRCTFPSCPALPAPFAMNS